MSSLLCLLFYAVIQIITEALPISSTSHLYLFKKLSGCTPIIEEWFYYLLHLPTLVVIFSYYRHYIYRLYYRAVFIMAAIFWGKVTTKEKQFLFCLFKAHTYLFLGAFFTWFFKYIFFSRCRMLPLFYSPLLTALTLSIAQWGTFSHKKAISLKASCGLGIAQALCGFLGISRFASSFVSLRLLGISASKALRFSFLSFSFLITGALFQSMIFLSKDPFLLSFVLSFQAIVVASVAGFLSFFLFRWTCKRIERRKFLLFIGYLILLSFLIRVIG